MQPLLVTAAVIISQDKVLITRRPEGVSYGGYWEFPGGKVEAGESPEEALIREIREELGADVAIMEIFKVVYHRYDWGPVLILAYRCLLSSHELQNIGVAEHRWVGLRELQDYTLLPADGPIAAQLASLQHP